MSRTGLDVAWGVGVEQGRGQSQPTNELQYSFVLKFTLISLLYVREKLLTGMVGRTGGRK